MTTVSTLSVRDIDSYYKHKARYELADRDYELRPNVSNHIRRQKALMDLVIFCLTTVAGLAGDNELAPVSWRDF